jgi:hypothetical protein
MIGRLNDIDVYNQECHIIGIGIDKYKSSKWTVLKNCQSDVERFINKTCSSFKTFEDSNDYVTRIYGGDATKFLIDRAIKGKINSLGHHQNLIIYFAGHGIDLDGSSYLVPYDAQTKYLYPDKSKLISFKELFDWIHNTEALHVVLILDCCHSGRIMNAKRANQDISKINDLNEHLSADFDYMMKTKSSWVITSGSGAQTVSDGNANGSPFSQALMKALNSSIKSGYLISIARIGSLLKPSLKAYKQYPNYKELSDTLGYEQLGGEFVFEPNSFISKVVEPEKPIKRIDKLEVILPEVVPILDFKPSEPIIDASLLELPVFEKYPIQYQDDYIEKLNEAVLNNLNLEQNVHARKKKIFGTVWFFFLTLGLLIIMISTVFSKDIAEYYTTLTTRERIHRPITSNEIEFNPASISFPNPSVVLPKLPEIFQVWDAPAIKRKYQRVFNKPFYAQNDNDTIKDNLVFVGSFQVKENAEALKQKLQNSGYQKTEIIMKEDLPYAVVVTGFHDRNKAKAEAKAIKKKGIEVYSSKADLSKIYRK